MYACAEITSSDTVNGVSCIVVDGTTIQLVDIDFSWFTGDALTGYELSKNTTTSTANTSVGNICSKTVLTNTHTPTTWVTVVKEVTNSGVANDDISGFAFHLYGTSAAGDTVDMYAVTNNMGIAYFTYVPLSDGDYTLEEVSYDAVSDAAGSGNTYASAILSYVTKDLDEYVAAWSDTFAVSDTGNISYTVTNTLKSWYLTVTKMDSKLLTYGSTQEGYSLEGAVYGLYDADDNLVAKYETDINGQFTTGYYACHEGWYIREISSSLGYAVDTTKYYIDASTGTITAPMQPAYFTAASTYGGYSNVVLEDPELVSANVIKYWTDNDDEMGVRPSSLAVTLYRKSDNVSEETVCALNLTGSGTTWSGGTSNLVKYDSLGAEYTYYWKESGLGSSYTLTTDGISYTVDGYELVGEGNGFLTGAWRTTLSNKITVYTPVTITKTWDDDTDAQGIRPDVLYVQIYANSTLVDVEGNEVTASTTADTAVAITDSDATSTNVWSKLIAVLPKYDNSGAEIAYTVSEVTSATTLIVDGKTVTVTADDVSWYTGNTLTGYTADYSYSSLSTGTAVTQTAITNTHTPNGSITVTEKIPAEDFGYYYDDTSGTLSFTFKLTGQNTGSTAQKTLTFTKAYVDANTTGGYVTISHTFEQLVYDTYTLTKTSQPNEWEYVSLTLENGTKQSSTTGLFVLNNSTINNTFGAVYADSYEPKMSITVTKKIDTTSLAEYGDDSEFVFTLTRSDGATYTKTITIPASTDPNSADADGYVSVSATFDNLSYGYTCTLKETDMPDRWGFISASAVGGTASSDTVTYGSITKANAKDTYTASYINEYVLGTITIIKYGDNDVLLDGVTYTLYDEDGNTVDTGTTGDDGTGTVIFKNLKAGDYRITETSTVDGYSLLADAIEATVPLKLTDAEYQAYVAAGIYIDVSKASSYRNGVYQFNDLTYTITDTANLALPITGNAGRARQIAAVVAAILMLAAAGVAIASALHERKKR